MTALILPSEPAPLARYLAAEEWVASHLPAGEYFFTWQPATTTVICGRNQRIDLEVDLAYCREHGIDVVRRRSGGGCVYSDGGNLMLSYIAPAADVQTAFIRYTGMVAEALRSLGLPAEPTGRNDVEINGRKVSGNAFYHLHDRAIAHGTLLCKAPGEHFSKAITPSRAKKESKGVKSVEARVGSLEGFGLSLSVAEVSRYLISNICDSEYRLSDSDLREVREIEQTYYDPAYLNLSGHEKRSRIRRRHIPGVGELSVAMDLDADGRISAFDLGGDFFAMGEVRELCGALVGAEPTGDAIADKLAGIHTENYIQGLKSEDLVKIITE